MRVASLYLPNLSTDRIRRIEGSSRPDTSRSSRAKAVEDLSGTRIEDCSCPRGGGWRPGARWAQGDMDGDEWLKRRIARNAAKKAALMARIETLPAHQRPPIRELGRRSEPMPNPFGPMTAKEKARSDEASAGRTPYDLEGAFWHQGRLLGGAVARAVGREEAESPEGSPVTHPDAIPLVTVRRERQRNVIAAACPAAHALGIAPGMPLTQARAMVPKLDVRPADPEGEAADLDRLARHAARHWTPLVTIVDGEGLWLEIGASAHLFGGEAGFARRTLGLCRRLGLTARIAVADTAAAAHALAKSAGRPLTICPSGKEGSALAALPLTALRIDPAIAELARRLGVETAGELAALPRAPLVRRFGKELIARLDETSGARAQPLEVMAPLPLPCATLRFAEPILTAEAIGQALAELVRDLAATLTARGLGARSIILTLTRIDAIDQSVSIGLARPSRDCDHILRLLCGRIEAIEPGFGIETMLLVAERVDPLEPQFVAQPFGDPKKAIDIASLVDRLANRLGRRRLYKLSAVESDVPERSQKRVEPLCAAVREGSGWPRPTRLLDPPEPVRDVMALLPDGVPRRFTWRGQAHTIVRGDGPERIYGEWWRRTAERDAIRDYFQVEERSGARFWLFRRGDGIDPRTGDMSWHVHGLFG